MSEILWNEDNYEYVLRERVDSQTIEMGFQEDLDDNNTVYYNIYLAIYSKRKHMGRNECNKIITGKNPIQNVIIVKHMFERMQQHVLEENEINDVVIYCHWVDGRRREAYYKVLSCYGYSYQNIAGSNMKVIARRFKWNKETEQYV